MRILFLSHYFPPEGNAPATRTWEHCRRWVELGHEVTVVTCAPNVPDGVVYEGYRNRLRPQREVVDGIHVVRVWTYIAPNKGTILRIANFLSYMFSAIFFSFFLKRPDVVLATSPQFFNGWAGVWVGRLRRVPFVLEIRDIWPETISAIGAMSNKGILRFMEFLERRLYRAADHIVAVGKGYKQNMQGKGVSGDKISIIPNGADLNFFRPRKANVELKRRYGSEQDFVCSYIGTIGLCSGLDVVPRAAKILKERGEQGVTFLLVGDGAVRESLNSKCRDMGLNNVLFTGRQDKALMPDFLALSDVCLAHLQRKDLFKTVLPSKIFEAAAMERPIILGVEGCAAELLEDAKAGICIEPENAEQLVEAVLRLRADKELARGYGVSGRRYIEEHFDRAKLAEQYLQILENCGRSH